MKTNAKNGMNPFRLILVVTLTVIVLNLVSGNRMTKFVTEYFTIEWENEEKDAETLHEERVQELEERIDEFERLKREKELEDKVAELEDKLERYQHQRYKRKKQLKETQPAQPKVDINGTWMNTVNNTTYKIHQFDDKVTFQEVEKLYGIETITAAGEGKIVDEQLSVDFNTIYTTKGKAHLNIKTENNELVGYSKDLTTGGEMVLKLVKVGS